MVNRGWSPYRGNLRSFGMDDQSDESVLFVYKEAREPQPISVRRCFAIANKELQINEEIRDKEVRVIGADGEQLGIMSSRDAFNLAQEKSLDLVKIAPQAQPPVRESRQTRDGQSVRASQRVRDGQRVRDAPPVIPPFRALRAVRRAQAYRRAT